MTVVTEAWRTIVPAKDDPDGLLPPLLLGLTFVTGLVDAFSYLQLGHVFVANMTGNVVFLGFALAGASGFSVAASLVALGAFALGAGIGGRVGSRLGQHPARLVSATCTLEGVLIIVALVVSLLTHPWHHWVHYVLILFLATGLGLQNATARRLAVADLTTTVLTMTITGVAADSRVGGGHGSKAGRRLLALVTMALGALVGSLLTLKVGTELPLLVAAGAAAAIVAVTVTHPQRIRGGT